MLLYAEIAGAEMGRASSAGREFDITSACHRLAAALVRGKWREPLADALIACLRTEAGAYFARLLQQHGREAHSRLDDETLQYLVEVANKVEFGPQLVIANIVENTFGSIEAAKYVIAVLSGRAR
jgi:hypothetical protein